MLSLDKVDFIDGRANTGTAGGVDFIDGETDTVRFFRGELCVPSDPDATSIYNLGKVHVSPLNTGHDRFVGHRLRQALRQDIAGLRAALAAGWDVGPELEHEQRRLSVLEDTACLTGPVTRSAARLVQRTERLATPSK